MNCATCRHWNRDRSDFQMTIHAGYHPEWTAEQRDEAWRRANEADPLFGRCQAIRMGPADVDELPLALAMDGSQYLAEVYTRAEFGCVMHEPAPAAAHTDTGHTAHDERKLA